MKVSVIIAVYNAERFLSECLDSLLAQTMTDFEAICVDDGSTDSSWQILSDYARRDSRFVTIRMEQNSGQSHARNVALQKVSGDYICMLDSDDWFSPDALQKAVAVFERNQLTGCVLFTLRMVYADHEEAYQSAFHPTLTTVLSGEEAFSKSFSWQIHGLYMVRADIHKRYPYDETCRVYSDDNSSRFHFLASREVRFCDGVYFYRQHTESVSHAINIHRFDALRAAEVFAQQLREQGFRKELLKQFESHRWLILIDVYRFYFMHRSELSPSARRYGLKEMRRVWATIDTALLSAHASHKFGYLPLRPFWYLFRLQEEVYFSLKRLLRRI